MESIPLKGNIEVIVDYGLTLVFVDVNYIKCWLFIANNVLWWAQSLTLFNAFFLSFLVRNIAGPRAARLTKERQDQALQYEAARQLIKDQNAAGLTKIGNNITTRQ